MPSRIKKEGFSKLNHLCPKEEKGSAIAKTAAMPLKDIRNDPGAFALKNHVAVRIEKINTSSVKTLQINHKLCIAPGPKRENNTKNIKSNAVETSPSMTAKNAISRT